MNLDNFTESRRLCGNKKAVKLQRVQNVQSLVNGKFCQGIKFDLKVNNFESFTTILKKKLKI